MENTEKNCEMIWKIQKKSKLNSEKIGKTGTIQFTFLPYFPYFPYLITIPLAFLPYFPYHFTIFFHIFPIISLFLLYFWKICKKDKSNSDKILENTEEYCENI
jgi:hypothetical protein